MFEAIKATVLMGAALAIFALFLWLMKG